MEGKQGFGSICVHDVRETETTRPHQLPIYATSSFEFDDIQEGIDIFSNKKKGHVYGRYGNPTIDSVAKKITALECHNLDCDAEGLFVNSGMAAVSTLVISLLKPGDKILTQGNLYGGTTELLNKIFNKYGIETVFTDLTDHTSIEVLLSEQDSIKMLYFESPANPTLACVDIEAMASLGRKYNVLTVIDNTFATPYLQQPFTWGVDYIIHSTTKYLNGHGNSIAGIIIGKNRETMKGEVWNAMKLLGTNTNAFDAWLVNLGLKTLEIRMDRHCTNAMIVASYLENHTRIKKVNYPGLKSHRHHQVASKQMKNFGGMLSFEVDGGLREGIRFMNNISFCKLAPTLGDVDSLILHPASMSHLKVPKEIRERNDITDGLIRLSVGIETVQDIIDDLEKGLKSI